MTVTFTKKGEFGVSIIPHTYRSTTLKDIRTGDIVNLETDIIAKYIEKLITGKKSLTIENLKELEDTRLLNPDTQDGRYRPKLAGWATKLAYLLKHGWEPAEIKRWAKGRFKSDNPRQWPPERTDWQ